MCGSWLCGAPSARVAGVYLLERLFAFLIPAGALPHHIQRREPTTDGVFGADVYEMASMTSRGVFFNVLVCFYLKIVIIVKKKITVDLASPHFLALNMVVLCR